MTKKNSMKYQLNYSDRLIHIALADAAYTHTRQFRHHIQIEYIRYTLSCIFNETIFFPLLHSFSRPPPTLTLSPFVYERSYYEAREMAYR